MPLPARAASLQLTSTLLLVVVYLAFISLGLPDSVLGVAWPHMRETLDLPLDALGLLNLLLTLFSAASSFLSGYLIRVCSTGPLVLISCLLTASGLLVFAFLPGFGALLLAAIPLGFGAGCVDSSLNNFVARHYSSRHMNWLHAFWGVGATLGPVIMTTALVSSAGWPGGYLRIAWAQLGLAALFLFTLPLWKRHENSVNGGGEGAESHHGKEQVRSSAAGMSVLIFSMYTGLEGCTGLWANSLLVDVRGIPQETAGLWVAAYFGSIMVGRVFVGIVAERWNNRRLATAGLSLGLLGASLFWLTGISWLPLVGLILIGLGFAPVYPCLMHETPRRFTAEATPVIIGRQVGSSYVGIAVVPGLVGWMAAHSTLEILSPILGLGIGILLYLLHRLNRMT